MEWVQVPDKSMSFVIPSKDLALMTVWCFLAGFSEVLVPNLLTGAERQFADGIARRGSPASRTRPAIHQVVNAQRRAREPGPRDQGSRARPQPQVYFWLRNIAVSRRNSSIIFLV